jgi:hypothetical protein
MSLKAQQIHLLDVPVPPQIGRALGFECHYMPASHWFGAFADPQMRECFISDGCATLQGDLDGLMRFVHHPAVKVALSGYDIGTEETSQSAAYWLIVRTGPAGRLAFVAPPHTARQFLYRENFPPGHKVTPRSVREFLGLPEYTPVDLERIKNEMIGWLDTTPHADRALRLLQEFTGIRTGALR